MRAYLSGPITGIENNNKEGFDKAKAIAESDLRFTSIVNPLEIDPGKSEPQWSDYMKADIKELVDCDAIIMLPGWGQSRGAKIEFMICDWLGIRIFQLRDGLIVGG